jgi:hypothetical protein
MGLPFDRWLPTRDTIRILLAPALVFIATSLDRGYQTDYWQHLARGALIAREHAVVSVDRFTFTVPGRAYYDNNWLTQLLYYGLHRVGDLALVQFVNSLALAAGLAGLVALCRRASGSTACAAAAGVMAFLGLWPTLLIRPQTFSILLFVGLYALLLAARRRPRVLVWAPPIMAVWANVHGGFAVGLALIFAFALGAVGGACFARAWGDDDGRRRRRPYGNTGDAGVAPTEAGDAGVAPTGADAPRQLFPLVSCLALSAVATLANPYGWDVYRYAGRLSAVGVARGIEEWLPPTVGSPIGLAFFASVVVVGLLIVVCRRRPTVTEACVLACFALPAFGAARMTVWWHLAAAPVIARLAAEALLARGWATTSRGDSARPSRVACVALVGLAVVCVLSVPWMEKYNPVLGTLRPAGRTETDLQTVAEGLAGREGARVFTRLDWANYLAWSLEGRCPVFVEGHVELYPDETWRQYVAVAGGSPRWGEVLDRYGVDYLLLDEADQDGLLSRVRQSPRWIRRARAGPAVLFGRRETARAAGPSHGLGGAQNGAAGAAAGPAGPVAGGDF